MSNCIVCQEKEGEMDFNFSASLGMLSTSLCLDCWGLAGDDMEIVFIAIHRRKERLSNVFPFLTDARVTWALLEKRHGPEKTEQVKQFLLTGVCPEPV